MSFWWKDNRAIVDPLLGYNLTVSPEIKGYKPWFLDDGTPDYESIGETMIYCAPRSPYDLFINQLRGMPTLWDKPKSSFNGDPFSNNMFEEVKIHFEQTEDSFVELIIKRAEMMIAEQPDFYLEYTGLNYSHSVLPASILESNCF